MSERTDEKAARRNALKNVKWVAHYLSVTRNTVHQWVLEGHIPYINLGVAGGRRIIRFDPETIETWLEERSYQSAQEDPHQEKLKADIESDKQDLE
ncbi:MAG TPA: helix-turn-helix domain-containing protein [bacterium]|nr:helix-turn-helix domain-containing protein [bacterium]